MSLLFSDNPAVAIKQIFEKGLYEKAFVVCDDNTFKYCIPLFSSFQAKILVVSAGESCKNLSSADYIWWELTSHLANKKTLLVNIGGGSVCDLGGFTASCYMRGIDFVNIPTTLLAMADAAHGGKNGINLGMRKNMVGTITFPKATIICKTLLQTLPKEEWLNGWAEIIKHALIANKSLLAEIKTQLLQNNVECITDAILQEAIRIKNQIVTEDPNEKNTRKLLNFGHTTAHAIEAYASLTQSSVPHGYAVVWGMVAEMYLSEHLLGFNESKNNETLLASLFPTFPFQYDAIPTIVKMALSDKKNNLNQINFTLLKQNGEGKINCFPPHELFEKALQYLVSNKWHSQ